MKEPEISVIIPTFNRAELLVGAVNSVLNQTLQNFELIISDNQSTDNTQKVCRDDIEKNNTCVKYVRNHKNLGMIGNWNAGLEIAKGKYICILMDDDRLEKTFLEETYPILKKDSELGFVVAWLQHYLLNPETNKEILIERNKYAYKLYSTDKKVTAKQGFKKYLKRSLKIGLPSCILFRKTDLRFNQFGLDPGYWLDMMNKFGAYYYLDKPLARQVNHSSEQFSTSDPDKFDFYRQVYCANKAFNYLLELDQTQLYPNELDDHRKIINSQHRNLSKISRILDQLKYV